jgi:hypothetical protein
LPLERERSINSSSSSLKRQGLSDLSTTEIKNNLTIPVVARTLALAWQTKAKNEMKNGTPKAKKQQTPRVTATGEWLYCNFSARPEEIAEWKALAQAERRSLSSWIRDVLTKEIARRKGFQTYDAKYPEKARGEATEMGVAEISGDRARSGN